jgi:hypothetical protein
MAFLLFVLTVCFYYIAWDAARRRYVTSVKHLVDLCKLNRELLSKHIDLINSTDIIERKRIVDEIEKLNSEYDEILRHITKIANTM